MTEGIDLTPEQRHTFLKARADRFKERYDQLVAETGMEMVAVVHSNPFQGVYPTLLILPKNPPKSDPAPTVPESERKAATD